MATYQAAARSNTFSVHEPDALKAELDPVDGIEVQTPDPQRPNRVALFCDEGWPSTRYDEQAQQCVPVSIAEIVAPHLLDDHVVVLIEAGHERLRSVCGVAVAVNNRGERRVVDLSGIYALALELGANVEEI